MAAEKLTRGRFVQIIIMLTILIAAFIWRTVDYQKVINVACSTDEKCTFFVNDFRFYATLSKQSIKLETDENDWRVRLIDSDEILPRNGNIYLINLSPEIDEITFQLSLKNANIDRYVSIKSR
ncbi:hypothetical protein [Vibrio sinaloensis]|uniref:Uncharacterized protein n=1 Tax=Photobacterium sp. (strain ATCC 43367) TaxID=379097 RepID=A0A0A5I408_PHOS4|nr:hypothetical protein [Vibrio sinaloensis]KGY10586.1 hypothetical protein NM06_00575 [Vibrio sinaloensis]